MLITEEYINNLSSSDISDLSTHIVLKGGYNGQCKTLQELFDSHSQFISYLNEWKQMLREFKKADEEDYVNYMLHIENTNSNIFNNLNINGVSFDPECTSITDFIELQTKGGSNFPFGDPEIVGWDADNFILKDTIYYEMTGNHAIFFLARLDKSGEETKKSLKLLQEKL